MKLVWRIKSRARKSRVIALEVCFPVETKSQCLSILRMLFLQQFQHSIGSCSEGIEANGPEIVIKEANSDIPAGPPKVICRRKD